MSDLEIRRLVLKALEAVKLPAQKLNVIESKLMTRLDIKEQSVLVEYRLPEANSTFQKSLEYQTQKAIQSLKPDYAVAVEFVIQAEASAEASAQAQESAPPRIGCMIAVGSGKGGVGKSSVTVNLAMALKAMNYRVGILDCDIYGPSIPTMMGVEGKKPLVMDQKIQPIEAHGIQLMSAGFFVEEDQGLIWRGPMIHKLIQQFYKDVNWDGTDVLLVDLPPGTGDAPLSLSQTMPLTGALLVSLPQKVSVIDVKRAYAMFQQVRVPVFGMIENMSEFICPNCDHHESLFGEGQVEALAQSYGVPLLGRIPIEPRIRKGADEGHPFFIQDPQSATAEAFTQIAKRLGAVLRTADEAESSSLEIVM